MEWSGRITTCDRCGRECRRSFLNEKEMDGGFTVLKNFREKARTINGRKMPAAL